MDESKEELIRKLHEAIFVERDDSLAESIYDKIAIKYLYQYRSGKCTKDDEGMSHLYDVENLYQNVVWASPASSFNDPYDSRFLLSIEIDCKSELQKEHIIGFNEFIQNLTEHTYVSCFSENETSLCMWSYYANNHRGFCVEYRTDYLEEYVYPVNYSNECDQEAKIGNIAEIEKRMLTKATDWKHEREWRMLTAGDEDKNTENGRRFKSCRPSKIFLGCKSEAYLIDALTVYCNKEKVDLYHMTMDIKSYKLIPKSILKF